MLIVSCILLIINKIFCNVKENNTNSSQNNNVIEPKLLEFKNNVGVIVWKDNNGTSTTYPSKDINNLSNEELSITTKNSDNLDSSLKNKISHIYVKSGFECKIKSKTGYLTETITNENNNEETDTLNYYFEKDANDNNKYSKIYLLEEDNNNINQIKFPSYEQLSKFYNENNYSIKPIFKSLPDQTRSIYNLRDLNKLEDINEEINVINNTYNTTKKLRLLNNIKRLIFTNKKCKNNNVIIHNILNEYGKIRNTITGDNKNNITEKIESIIKIYNKNNNDLYIPSLDNSQINDYIKEFILDSDSNLLYNLFYEIKSIKDIKNIYKGDSNNKDNLNLFGKDFLKKQKIIPIRSFNPYDSSLEKTLTNNNLINLLEEQINGSIKTVSMSSTRNEIPHLYNENGLDDIKIDDFRYKQQSKDSALKTFLKYYFTLIESSSGDEEDYRGLVNFTKSGRTCQVWSTDDPHEHSRKPWEYKNKGLDFSNLGDHISGNHNYCRNPDDEKRAWCYTTDPNKRWEDCDTSTYRHNLPRTIDHLKKNYRLIKYYKHKILHSLKHNSYFNMSDDTSDDTSDDKLNYISNYKTNTLNINEYSQDVEKKLINNGKTFNLNLEKNYTPNWYKVVDDIEISYKMPQEIPIDGMEGNDDFKGRTSKVLQKLSFTSSIDLGTELSPWIYLKRTKNLRILYSLKVKYTGSYQLKISTGVYDGDNIDIKQHDKSTQPTQSIISVNYDFNENNNYENQYNYFIIEQLNKSTHNPQNLKINSITFNEVNYIFKLESKKNKAVLLDYEYNKTNNTFEEINNEITSTPYELETNSVNIMNITNNTFDFKSDENSLQESIVLKKELYFENTNPWIILIRFDIDFSDSKWNKNNNPINDPFVILSDKDNNDILTVKNKCIQLLGQNLNYYNNEKDTMTDHILNLNAYPQFSGEESTNQNDISLFITNNTSKKQYEIHFILDDNLIENPYILKYEEEDNTSQININHIGGNSNYPMGGTISKLFLCPLGIKGFQTSDIEDIITNNL